MPRHQPLHHDEKLKLISYWDHLIWWMTGHERGQTLKCAYSYSCKLITELRSIVTCHLASHTDTCHLTLENVATIWLSLIIKLRSHKHEYESSTVRVPVYEFRQTQVCVYFNGGHSHTYEYGLPANFTRTSSSCAGRVFIQLVESKLLTNSINVIYKNRGAYLTSRLMSS